MPRASPLIDSFAAGEVSARLEGRIPLPWYRNSCRLLQNMIALPQGPAQRRSGTRFVGEIKDSTRPARVFRFRFNVDVAYTLEFGRFSLRFYRNRARILDDAAIVNGDFAAGIAGWTDISAGTGAIAHDAGNQRLDLVGAGAGNEARAEQLLTNLGTAAYTVTLDVFTGAVAWKAGSSSGAADIASGTAAVGLAQSFSFQPSSHGDVYLTFENANADTRSLDNVALDNPIYEIDTPWDETEVFRLKFAQSADVVSITQPDHQTRELSRFGDANWTLALADWEDGPYLPVNLTTTTLKVSAATGSGVTVTASAAVFQAGHVGALFRLSEASGALPSAAWTSSTPYTANGKVRNDGKLYEAQNSATSGDIAPVHDRPDEIQSDGAVSWKFLHDGNGYVKITGFTSQTVVTADVKSRIPDSAVDPNTTERWREGAWSSVRGYPACVTFYESRQWLANTAHQPDTWWATRIEDLRRFSPGTLADDALQRTANDNEVNPLLWLLAGRRLNAASPGNEWQIRSSGLDEPITPDNATFKPQSAFGSADLQGLRVGDGAVVFVEDGGRKLLELVRSVSAEGDEGFAVTDISLRGDHLVSRKIVDFAYQKKPWPIFWCVLADGLLAAVTYLRAENVIAWQRHPIGGSDATVESVTTLPGPKGDEVWLTVKRTINGQTKRYVEFIEDAFDDQTAQADAFFVDSGLSYAGPPVSTVSGLDHLEGETVQLLIDGATHGDVTVVGGQVTLERAGAKIHAGLAFPARLKPARPEAGAVEGTAQGRTKQIHELGLRVYRSLGFKVGPGEAELEQAWFREVDDLMDTAVELFSGDVTFDYPGDYETDGDILIAQDLPLPLTVVAIMPRVTTNEG